MKLITCNKSCYWYGGSVEESMFQRSAKNELRIEEFVGDEEKGLGADE